MVKEDKMNERVNEHLIQYTGHGNAWQKIIMMMYKDKLYNTEQICYSTSTTGFTAEMSIMTLYSRIFLC